MATVSDVELVCAVVTAQGLRCMEATEAGADGLKIDYCEASTSEEVAERVRQLAGNVRGLFIVRCWSNAEQIAKPGRKTVTSSPYAWRIMGTAGTPQPAPAPIVQESQNAPSKISGAELELVELRAKLDRQEQEFRHRLEMDALKNETLNGADEPDQMDAAERTLDIVDRIAERFMPLLERMIPVRPAKAIQGTPLPTDELERLIVLIERFKAAEPAQFAAIEAQLIQAYGNEPDTASEPETPKKAANA